MQVKHANSSKKWFCVFLLRGRKVAKRLVGHSCHDHGCKIMDVVFEEGPLIGNQKKIAHL